MRRDWLTTTEYAAMAGVTRRAVVAWCSQGAFAGDAVKIGKQWLIRWSPFLPVFKPGEPARMFKHQSQPLGSKNRKPYPKGVKRNYPKGVKRPRKPKQ